MRVIWTERALTRAEEIYDYIAKDSPVIAQELIKRFFAATEQIELFSKSGRRPPEVDDGCVRELICESYRIIYQIDVDIEILSIRHSRQRFDESELK